jgi:hypothetical protein
MNAKLLKGLSSEQKLEIASRALCAFAAAMGKLIGELRVVVEEAKQANRKERASRYEKAINQQLEERRRNASTG